MKTIIGMLTMEDQMAIESKLKEFLIKSESRWASLMDKGGNLLAQTGETGGVDVSILSALAAGSFAATHELAKRLNEQDFKALYHEGEQISIFINALEFDCLVMTIFEKQKTNVGLVRFYAQQYTSAFNKDLDVAHKKQQAADSGISPLPVDEAKAIF